MTPFWNRMLRKRPHLNSILSFLAAFKRCVIIPDSSYYHFSCVNLSVGAENSGRRLHARSNLIGFKIMSEALKQHSWKILQFPYVAPHVIVVHNCDDLVISFITVNHLQSANWSCTNDNFRFGYRPLANNTNIKRI